MSQDSAKLEQCGCIGIGRSCCASATSSVSRPHRHPADPRPRLGSRGRQGRSPHPQQVGSPAGALRAHRRPTAPRPQSRHRRRWSPSTPSPPTSSTTTGATPAPARGPGDRRAAVRRGTRPAPALHRLTVGALRAVADAKRPRELVLDAYLLRAMGIAGWAPSLTECARCAAPGPHRAFHIAAGGSVCMHCRPSGSTTPPQAVVDLMSALHDGDWEAAEASSPSHPQPRQRPGGRPPAMAPGTPAAHPAAGGAGLPAAHRPR